MMKNFTECSIGDLVNMYRRSYYIDDEMNEIESSAKTVEELSEHIGMSFSYLHDVFGNLRTIIYEEMVIRINSSLFATLQHANAVACNGSLCLVDIGQISDPVAVLINDLPMWTVTINGSSVPFTLQQLVEGTRNADGTYTITDQFKNNYCFTVYNLSEVKTDTTEVPAVVDSENSDKEPLVQVELWSKESSNLILTATSISVVHDGIMLNGTAHGDGADQMIHRQGTEWLYNDMYYSSLHITVLKK